MTATAQRKRGANLVVNDIVVVLSNPHRISHFADYPTNSPLHAAQGGPLPTGTRIAYSPNPSGGNGWGMTICPDDRIEVI